MEMKDKKQSRSAPKNAEIVAAARELFLRKGFSAISMDLIADTAGVSKRTVYSHFESKENLFGAVMMDLCRETCPPDVAEEQAPDLDMSPEDLLIAMGLKYLSVNLLPDAIALYRIVLSEGVQFPELAKMYWEFPKMFKANISGLLTEWNRQGIISIPDPDTAAAHFLGMLRSPLEMPLLFELKKTPTKNDIDTLVKQAVSIFLNGLKQS